MLCRYFCKITVFNISHQSSALILFSGRWPMMKSSKKLNKATMLDHYTFLEICPPTPPLSQHFALSEK